MTSPTAFDRDVLARRDRRGRRAAALRNAVARGGFWLVALAVTLLVLFAVAGFAEGPRREVAFAMPWQWLGGALSGEVPMHRATGAALMLFAGGWLAVIGLSLVRRLLSFEPLAGTAIGGAFTVARAGVDEAVRNRTVVVLVCLLLVILAGQPFLSMDGIEEPLRYEIQFFLSFAGFASSLLLGGVTIFTAAAGVSGDLEGRRAGGVFVKPVPRWAYLLGRWLGAALPAAVLVAVTAVLSWLGAVVWLEPQRALDAADRDIVNNRVLVARGEVPATPNEAFALAVENELARIRRDDPDRLQTRGEANLVQDLINEQRTQFLALEFQQPRTYTFRGLGEAYERATRIEEQLVADADDLSRRIGELGYDVRPGQISLGTVLPFADALGLDLSAGRVQLRFEVTGVNTFGASEGTLGLEIDGQRTQFNYTVDRVQVRDLPGTLIGDDGVLEIDLAHLGQVRSGGLDAAPIQFKPDTWLNVYYREGSFAGNVVRQAIVLWTRLAFLAMLATVAASVLTFPVATTLALVLWTLAAGGTWLQGTLSSTSRLGEQAGMAGDVFTGALVPVALFIARALAAFSEVDGTARLSDGLYLPWSQVVSHVLWVGVLWTGLAFAIGLAFFSRREIARVQV